MALSEISSAHFAQLAHFLEPHFFFEKPSKINVKVIDIVRTQLSKSLSDFHKTQMRDQKMSREIGEVKLFGIPKGQ